MAVQSTYFMMTPEILLEYRTDRYNIIKGGMSKDKQPRIYYIYKGKDGRIVYTEDYRYTDKNSRDWYKNQAVWQKFPDSNGSSYRWVKSLPLVSELMDYQHNDLIDYSTLVVNTASGHAFAESRPHIELDANIFYDSLNVYFLRGYALDNLDGITLSVKTSAACQEVEEGSVYKNAAEVTVFDAYIDKSMLYPDEKSGRISPMRLLASPLYMNSRFYDKYITLEFPSPYAIGLRDHAVIDDDGHPETVNDPTFLTVYFNEDGTQDTSKSDVYTVDLDSNIILEFGQVEKGDTAIVTVELNDVLYSSGLLSTPKHENAGSVLPESNADYFNARIYEDGRGNVIYCPVYGDTELNTDIMGHIQTGEIPITANAFHDAEASYQKFNDIDTGSEKLYKADSQISYLSRWKIYSDLVATYIYSDVQPTAGIYSLTYDETYSRIIDYEQQNKTSGIEFWKSKFTPDADIIRKLNAERICLKYTCRLVNELRGLECIRIATLFIDPKKYVDNISSHLNINTYKIVNRLPETTTNNIRRDVSQKEKLVRTYYNMTSVVAKDMGTGNVSYPQGQLTLQLNRTGNNYAIQLFNINDDNVRVPYDLTGPYKYKLVLPTTDANRVITIRQSQDNTKQQMGIGTLLFYITAEQARMVMDVPSGDRYFAVMTDAYGTTAQETTLYEGHVAWLS